MKQKCVGVLLMLCFSIFSLSGCSISEDGGRKIRDLDFVVMDEDGLEEELKKIIDEEKKEPFNITFTSQDGLYICIGYGEKQTGGYSITINDLYLSEQAIYVDTNLLGPSQEEKVQNGISYPYIVIKTERMDVPVVFK